jgi:hypothetical protein
MLTQSQAFQILALYQAVKLEVIGLKRRGRSATVIAKELLGMPRNTKRELVLARLKDMRDELTNPKNAYTLN